MPEASPFWQNAFVVGVLVAIGWCVWSGWRAGLVRALFSLAGMAAALGIGLVAGLFVAAIAGSYSLQGGLFAGWAVGAVVGLVVYGIATFIGALLFKRTGQQRTLLLRLLYGAGGAAVGAFIGLSVLWGALLFARGLGGFLGPRFDSGTDTARPNAAIASIVKLKRSIEAGETGRALVSLDVMPDSFYRTLEKFGQVMENPAAAERLLQYPEIVALLNDPKFVAISSEAAGGAGAEDERVSANRRLFEAMSDPALVAKLQNIDIEKALDFALREPDAPNVEAR